MKETTKIIKAALESNTNPLNIYDLLMEQCEDFRAFVKAHEHLSTEEIKEMYNL